MTFIITPNMLIKNNIPSTINNNLFLLKNKNNLPYNNILLSSNYILQRNIQCNILSKNILTNYDLILFTSILLETISTICLKKTKTNKLWFLISYSGYGISFYLFPKCLNKYSLNSAYSIWCGLGIIMTMISDMLIYKELLTIRKVLGTLLLITGIFIIK